MGGGFKYYSFSPLLGEMIQFDYAFSNGLNHQLVTLVEHPLKYEHSENRMDFRVFFPNRNILCTFGNLKSLCMNCI